MRNTPPRNNAGGGNEQRAQQTEPEGRVSGMMHAGVVQGLWEGQPSRSAGPTARQMFLPLRNALLQAGS